MPKYATLALVLGTSLTASCEFGLPAGTEPHSEFNFLDMGDQPKIKPQRASLDGTRATGMFAPPAGAVSREAVPYSYGKDEGEKAGAELSNALEASSEVVAEGEKLFHGICATCHGLKGAGDGEMTKVFPKPPSLMTQKVRDWGDGRIFHVVMRGQGSMPSHAALVDADEIWAITHYIRSLQSRLPVAPPPAVPAPAGTEEDSQ